MCPYLIDIPGTLEKVWELLPHTCLGRVQDARAAPTRRHYLEISTVSSNKAHKGPADERGHDNSNSDPDGDAFENGSESGNE